MRRHRYNSYYTHTSIAPIVIYILILVLVLGFVVYRPINKVSNMRNVTVTVTDKVVKNSNDDSKYLVFTEDGEGNVETYEITDSLLAGRFNSSDVYASIKVGNKYTFKIGGSRRSLLSWYPNIYEFTLIEE